MAERNEVTPYVMVVATAGNVVRTIKRDDGSVDEARVVLLVGFSIGLGMAVHGIFFLVGGAIAVGALSVATLHAVQEHAAHDGRPPSLGR